MSANYEDVHMIIIGIVQNLCGMFDVKSLEYRENVKGDVANCIIIHKDGKQGAYDFNLGKQKETESGLITDRREINTAIRTIKKGEKNE